MKNKKIKIMASVVILVIIVIFFIAGLITLKNTNKSNDERNKENYFVEDNDSINIHKEENEEISEEISK